MGGIYYNIMYDTAVYIGHNTIQYIKQKCIKLNNSPLSCLFHLKVDSAHDLVEEASNQQVESKHFQQPSS